MRPTLLLMASLATLLPLLSACDATIGLFRDVTGASKNDPGPDEPNSDALAAGGSQSFPNLASVPNAPKPALTAEQRDRLTRGLVADRANAVHTDQQIRAGTDIAPAPVGPAPRMGPVLEAASLPPVGPGGVPAPAVSPGSAPPPQPVPPPQPARPTTYVSPLGATETVPATAALPPARSPRPPAPLPQSLPDLPAPRADLAAPNAPPAAPSPEMAWAAPSVTMLPGRPAAAPDEPAAGGTTVATIPDQPGTTVAAPPPSSDAPAPPPRRETDLLSPDVRARPGAEVPQPPPGPPVLPPTPENTPVPIPAAGQVATAPTSPGLTQGATPGSPPPEVAPGGALSKLPRSTNSILLGQVDATSVDKRLITDVAQLQKEHSATIRLIGHAVRGQGADAANQQLTGYQAALGRANTIASALTDAGVPANKIVVEAAPVRTGSAAGDALNRTDVYAEY